MLDALSLLPEYSPDRFDSRYRLVIAASQRAKYLMQGAKPLGISKFTKDTTIALEEVLGGHLEYRVGKEARQATKEAKRGREGEIEKMVLAEAAEDAREIKKELSVYVDDSIKAEAEPESEEP